MTGFDTTVLTDAIARQADIERSSGHDLADVTEPTETAVSAAFARTAELARRPANARQLAAAGRHFGRIAHLLDAAEDLPADRAAAAFNPLLATGTTIAQARESCSEALGGLRVAVADLDLESAALAESLLVREVGAAVDRVFAGAPASSARFGPLPPFMAGDGNPEGQPAPRRRRRRDSGCDCCADCNCSDCDCSGCDCDCGGC